MAWSEAARRAALEARRRNKKKKFVHYPVNTDRAANPAMRKMLAADLRSIRAGAEDHFNARYPGANYDKFVKNTVASAVRSTQARNFLRKSKGGYTKIGRHYYDNVSGQRRRTPGSHLTAAQHGENLKKMGFKKRGLN